MSCSVFLLVLLNKMKTLEEFMVSGVNKGNEEGESKIFLCYPRDSRTSHQSFCERGDIFSACGLFISD